MAAYTSNTEKHLQKVDHSKSHWTDSYTIGDTVPVSGIYKCQGCNKGVVCGRGRNPTLRLWPTIFSGKIDVFPGDRRSRLISSMTSVAPA